MSTLSPPVGVVPASGALVLSPRALAPLERYFAHLHSLGWMAEVFTIRVEGRMERDTLQRAAQWVEARFPFLAGRIAPVGLEWALMLDAPQGVEVQESALTPDQNPLWPQVAEDASHLPFPLGQGPLWGLWLVQPTDPAQDSRVVFRLHHTISDGTTMSLLVHNLLQAYRRLAQGSPLDDPNPQPFTAPWEQRVGAKLTLGAILQAGGRILGRMFVSSTPFGERPSTLAERRHRLSPHIMSQAQSAALLAKCRAEKTTVLGALGAALLVVAARHAQGRPPWRFQLDTNVDMRAQCQPPADAQDPGMFISSVSWFFWMKREPDFWEVARQVKQKLQARIDAGDARTHPLMLRWFRPKDQDLLAAAERRSGRMQPLFVSNLGRFPFPESERGPYSLKEYLVTSTQHGLGAALWLGLTTVRGCFNVSFAYVTPILTKDYAEGLVEEAMALLLAPSAGEQEARDSVHPSS